MVNMIDLSDIIDSKETQEILSSERVIVV